MNITSFLAQASMDYGDSYYTMSSTNDAAATNAAAAAITAGMFVFIAIALVITYIITGFTLGRIFKKAGVESWKAWVPILNSWTLLELGGQKGYWAILALIPVLNIVAGVFLLIAMYHVGLKFGKEGAFVLLAIFLPLVWMIWLAVDKSTWKGQTTPVQVAQPPVNNQTPPPTTPLA